MYNYIFLMLPNLSNFRYYVMYITVLVRIWVLSENPTREMAWTQILKKWLLNLVQLVLNPLHSGPENLKTHEIK